MPNEFVAKNGLVAQNNSVVSGSLIVTNGITGSLFGTSSQAISASNAFSASFARTSSFANNFTVANTLTAQTLVVSTISSSVVYSSGSNIFGNNLSNTQVLTGSVGITGSLTVRGNQIVSGSSTITGSLTVSSGITGSLFGTASQALTASFVLASGVVGLNLSLISTGSVTASVGQSTASFQVTSGSNTLLYISSSGFSGFGTIQPRGRVHATGSSIGIIGDASDNFFGDYSTGDYIDIGHLGAVGSVFLDTRGTSANVNLGYRTKGTGNHIWTYGGGVSEAMRINGVGSVGIGTTSLTGMSLRVGKNITGATTGYGIHQDGVVQSDVTAIAHGFTNRLQTQATAFTLPQYNHYYAVQVALGAGSVLTTQAGFFADSSLTGATNNYGFYGNLATSGSRNWNFYAAGTAPNYIAGNLVIGTTTVPGSKLGIAHDNDFGINLFNVGTGGLNWQIGSTNNGYAAGGGKLIFTYNNLSANSILTLVQASNSIGINKTSPTATLDVSGSVLITGSLGVTQNITGSNARFIGTITAQTLVVQTVSSSIEFVTGSTKFGSLLTNTHQFTGSVTLTGSLAVNGSNVILTNQTSSMSVLSASFARSASYARSSSYADNLTVNGVLNFNNTLTDYATVGSSIVGSNNLFTRATSSYTSVFVNYTAAKGTSARSGQLMVVWNNGTAQFTDNSTLDVGGDTGYVTMSAAIVTNQVQVNAQTNSSGWVIKSMATYM